MQVSTVYGVSQCFLGPPFVAVAKCIRLCRCVVNDGDIQISVVHSYEVMACDSALGVTHRLQDEVVELRARLADAEENLVVKSQEFAAKEHEAKSARTLASTVEQQMQEAKSEILELKEASHSTAEELTSALASANELRCSVSKAAELEIVVGDLEAEKRQWEETAATLTSQLGELQHVVRSLEGEKARVLQIVQETEEGRALLVVQLRDIANLIG